MAKTSFRQSDLERIFRAAKSIDAAVQIDLKTLVLTILPPGDASIVLDPQKGFRPDGKVDWSDIDEHTPEKKPASWDFDL